MAPIRSCASAKRIVTWGFGNLDDLDYPLQVDCKRSRCRTMGPDEFGRVDCAYILLIGRVTTVSLTLLGNPYQV